MKINSIYDVIGNVDDKFVSEAAAVGRKKRPILLIVAVAAAALALMVGAAEIYNTNSTFSIVDKGIVITMPLKKHNITIPEEFMPTEENMYWYRGKADIGVVELFEKFNAPLLITDKFSAEVDPDSEDIEINTFENLDTGEHGEYKTEPFITVTNESVDFSYYIYSKTLEKNISFFAYYLTDKAQDMVGIKDGTGSKYVVDIIKLRDGSKCVVGVGCAAFYYNGVYYRFAILGEGELTSDMTMQVLEDLKVL